MALNIMLITKRRCRRLRKSWKALNRARLIFPKDAHPLAPGEVNWEGTEYSKCGRTDKGVSAFGQVIGIRVSNRPLGRDQEKEGNQESKKQGVAVESLDGTGAGRTNNMSPKEEGNADSFNTFPRPGGIELVASLHSHLPEELWLKTWMQSTSV